MSRVVVFVSHDGAAAGLGDLADENDVTIVGPAGDGVDIAVMVPDVPAPLRGAVSFARRSAAGRNLVRVTPLDQSRRLWRVVRKDARIAELIKNSDVVVAGDRDAILTVWKLTRKRKLGSSWPAVFGAAAARFALGHGQ